MTATDTTEAALIECIRAEPGADRPRLVYADWLEENGRRERAEFIAVQVELARTVCSPLCNLRAAGVRGSGCVCTRAALRRREWELLKAHGLKWLPEVYDVAWKANGIELSSGRCVDVEFRRGFVAGVSLTLAQLCGGPCEWCGEGRWVDSNALGIREYCPACSGTGRSPGITAALGRACPALEGVRVVGVQPGHGDVPGYLWQRESDGLRVWHNNPSVERRRYMVPDAVFDLLDAEEDKAQKTKRWASPDLAHAALSAAAVAYIRAQAAAPAGA